MSQGTSGGMAVAENGAPGTKDWAGSLRAYLVAWGIPSLVLIGAGLIDPAPRALVWSGGLVWMGTACLLNARRCGRTHCRYTGPYYLLLIVPVAFLGARVSSDGSWVWWVIGAMILLGANLIWLATEGLWGKYRA